MATVFLSYDREDARKARSVAAALQEDGHSVWWDQHIKAGRQYSKEIENALDAADAVVVLWSKKSVESAWVRDEAAAGRDSDRLIPARLDGCDPPLGFRQYQGIDLSRWNGRPGSAQLNDLRNAVQASSKPGPPMPAKAPDSVPFRSQWRRWIAGFAVALVIASAIFWRSKQSAPYVPLVAVAALDQSPGAKAWARDLLIKLGSLQTANSNDLRLVDQESEVRPDLVFEVGGSMRPEDSQVSLVLRSGKDRSLLWSTDLQQPDARLADLRQQLAHVAAQVLRCAVEGMAPGAKPLPQQLLQRYLRGCSAIAEVDNPRPFLPVFLALTRDAPQFGGAWAKLLKIEARMFALQNGAEQDRDRRKIEMHIAAARKVDRHMAEAFLAEAELLPKTSLFERIALLDRAVKYNPENSEALVQRSAGLLTVGRLNDALVDAQRAAQLDPLSPAVRDQYIFVLVVSGLAKNALEELAKADRLWPGATNLANTRFLFNLHWGNAKEALRTVESQRFQVGPTWATYETYLTARIDPSEANIERALSKARSVAASNRDGITMLMQAMGTWGEVDDLLNLLSRSPPESSGAITHVIFRPVFRDFWRDPRSMKVAAHLGLLDYWRRSGKWPDFCSEPGLPYDCKTQGNTAAATH